MVLRAKPLDHHVPAYHEYPALQRTHTGALFHTVHQRIEGGKSDNLIYQVPPK